MHTFVLQDWITIRGLGSASPTGPGSTVIQSEPGWLDLSQFQDLFAWVDVREVVNGASTVDLFLDTSPTEDERFFQSMSGVLPSGAPAVPGLAANASPYIVKLPMLSAVIPLSRYLRWRLVFNGTAGTQWDVTMRLVVAANSPGM